MTKINIKRLVENIKKTNVYTPIIEAIVNSLHSIEDCDSFHGEICVEFLRSAQGKMDFSDEGKSDIKSVKITDNGIGFNKINKSSFDTIYSEMKIEKGGKGFGRFTYLKYFKNIHIDSIYEDGGAFVKRSFDFINSDDIIENESINKCEDSNRRTVLILGDIIEEHQHKLDKKLETIARKLVEELLVYFVLDGYSCPRIILKDETDEIVLNDYIDKHKEVIKIKEEPLKIGEESFRIKIFKIYYTKTKSSINLIADNRLVSKENLSTYVPEFADDFYDIDNDGGKERNYVIKAYVLGTYLDKNVSLERDGFEFDFPNLDNPFPLNSSKICEKSSFIVKSIFNDEVSSRKEKKIKRIKEYVNNKGLWHKRNIDRLDLDDLPYKMTDFEIEQELYSRSFQTELSAKLELVKMMEGEFKFDDEYSDKLEKLTATITEAGESSLIHYVATRKVVLDLFSKSLEYTTATTKYETEGYLHDIIFPRNNTSETINFNSHNLWLLDEKLNFTEYLTSDVRISKENQDRPDLLIFNNRVAFRGENISSNPVTIFEFKRPGRDDFVNPKTKENPVEQIIRYTEEIREKKYDTAKGKRMEISETTPFYGYVVCELNAKVEKYLHRNNYKPLPDRKGYFNYNDNLNLYIEVVCWEKLLYDAELRNKVFFKKLGIEN